MATSGAPMDDPVDGLEFVYESLPISDKYVRLLTIHSIAPLISCSLTPLALEDLKTTRYSALSYAWGDQEPSSQIHLNGRVFWVRPNLEEALTRIYQYQTLSEEAGGHTMNVVVWNDATCINQRDDAEKDSQVGLMDQIYRCANVVLAWLGSTSPEHESDAALAAIPGLNKILSNIEDAWIDGQLVQAVAKHESSGLLRNVGRLFERAWFERLWVFQEVILATHLVCLCGTQSIEWSEMAKLSELVPARGLYTFVMGSENARKRIITGELVAVGDFESYRSEFAARKSLPLTAMLMAARNKKLSDPKDRIKGILGVIRPGSKERILPLCKEHDRHHHWLYVEVGKILIEEEALFTLSLASITGGGQDGFPSWCPQLHAPDKLYPLGTYDVPFEGKREGRPAIIPGTDRLRTRGRQISRVLRVANLSFEWPNSYYDDDQRISTADCSRSWETECRSIWREASGRQVNEVSYIQTMTASLQPNEYELGTYETMVKYFDMIARRPSVHLTYATPGAAPLMKLIQRIEIVHWGERRFYCTTDGQIGLGPKDMREGDLVCILYTGLTPFILRSQDDGASDKTYIFMGETYLHGSMDPTSFDYLNRSSDQTFILV